MKPHSLLFAALFVALAGFAADADSTSTRTVKGTVVDVDGKPMPGITIEALVHQQGAFSGKYVPGKTTTAGSDGTFTLQCGTQGNMLLARKDRALLSWLELQPGQNEVKLITPGSSFLAGKVVDEKGEPVAGAEVFPSMALLQIRQGRNTTHGYLGGKPAREFFCAKTAADGTFRIDPFPTNASARLTVVKAAKAEKAKPRGENFNEWFTAAAGSAENKLELEPAGSIAGRVVKLEGGEPVTGAELILTPQSGVQFGEPTAEPASAQPDGSFQFTSVAAGSYYIRTVFGTNTFPDWVADNAPVKVEAGQTVTDIRVPATPGGYLEVKVVGKKDKQPIDQAGVTVSRKAYSTDGVARQGVAWFKLPRGQYRVSAAHDGPNGPNKSVRVETGETNRVTVEIDTGDVISGVVRNEDGTPAANLRLAVLPPYWSNVGDVVTDAEGRFKFNWNPQRNTGINVTYLLLARDLARNLVATQDVEAEGTNHDLKLGPGLTIAGKVEAAEGKPLAKAEVSVNIMLGNMGSDLGGTAAETDADGRFEIKALPFEQRYWVHASAKGYGSGTQNVQSDDGNIKRVDLEAFSLRLANRKIAGKVLDPDDKPVKNAWINLNGDGQPNESKQTDASGTFEFTVCEGSVRLFVNGNNSYANANVDSGDTNIVITLQPQGRIVSEATPRRASLKSKPLPDVAAFGLKVESGKPTLLCLVDLEGRPSRRFAGLLAEQHDSLLQKGLTVLALQSTLIPEDTLKEWRETAKPNFPVGIVTEKDAKVKWTEAETIPWLILADDKGKVVAEGFPFEDLEAKLKELAK